MESNCAESERVRVQFPIYLHLTYFSGSQILFSNYLLEKCECSTHRYQCYCRRWIIILPLVDQMSVDTPDLLPHIHPHHLGNNDISRSITLTKLFISTCECILCFMICKCLIIFTIYLSKIMENDRELNL